LSVTRIETLRRDPYAIYAEYILRLKALDPVEHEIGPREIGTAWHAALQEFVETYPSGLLPPDARDRLFSIARQRFTSLLADTSFAALNWPRIETGLDFFLAFERKSRPNTERVLVEQQSAVPIPLASGAPFKLSARADRIDVLRSGGARLIDYKSGTPPGAREVEVGFAPQLTLEAAILRRGGFPGLPALDPAEALYLKLGGPGGGVEKRAGGEKADIGKLAEKHFSELKLLLDQFCREETPYFSRPFPKFASRFSDYDHLARVKEWSTTDDRDAGRTQDPDAARLRRAIAAALSVRGQRPGAF
jgi:ATP-dependent helicase/nuclease subunit B